MSYKKFKDLKVGDTIYVGFEKKVITKIVQDDFPDRNVLYISGDEFYYVYGYLSADYCFSSEEWLFTGKEAMIEHFTESLKELEYDYENNKSLYERWLERAKELE